MLSREKGSIIAAEEFRLSLNRILPTGFAKTEIRPAQFDMNPQAFASEGILRAVR